MTNILNDIRDTIDALSSGRKNKYTGKIRREIGNPIYDTNFVGKLSKDQVKECFENRPQDDTTESDPIIDFYRRFIYRMEYMMTVGKENGFDLISFMGP